MNRAKCQGEMKAPSFLGLSCGHVHGILICKGRNLVFRNEDIASDCEDEDNDSDDDGDDEDCVSLRDTIFHR